MPRFNKKRWHPSHDSSVRHIQRAIKEKKIFLDRAYDESGERAGCPCGCAQIPTGKKAIFAMGHDARFRGILIRAHLTSTPIVYVVKGGKQDGVEHLTTAWELSEEYGPHFSGPVAKAVQRREDQNRAVLAKAMGSKRLIRVGRWEYTGQVMAVYGENGDAQYDVEYVTKQGEIKRKRVDAVDAQEVG